MGFKDGSVMALGAQSAAWWRAVRWAANGRLEVFCTACRRRFWFSERELTWSQCPHCAGWWHL